MRLFIHLDVVELKTRGFDCFARLEDFELFSFIIVQIDAFLDHVRFKNNPVLYPFFDLRIKSENLYLYIENQFRNYYQDYRLALYKMKKEIHLVITDISKDFEVYQRSKNVDSVTLLPVCYYEHLHVFFKQETNMLSQHESHDHAIYFKKDVQLSSSVFYNINYNEATELRRYLNENFNKRFIRVSRFKIAASVLFIKKFDKGFRFCVDYRSLNVVIVKNRYFLFLISETLNRFSRVKIFIKLDIIVAFNRIRI